MRLLASTDIALRALMLLASEPSGQPLNVDKLSRLLGNLSRNHMHKIVQNLAAMGLVHTIRGNGGGVVLAVAPESIRIGNLIHQLEGDQPVVECFRDGGGNCTLTAGCRLRGYLRDARSGFYSDLDQHTIADCLPRRRPEKGSRRRSPARGAAE